MSRSQDWKRTLSPFSGSVYEEGRELEQALVWEDVGKIVLLYLAFFFSHMHWLYLLFLYVLLLTASSCLLLNNKKGPQYKGPGMTVLILFLGLETIMLTMPYRYPPFSLSAVTHSFLELLPSGLKRFHILETSRRYDYAAMEGPLLPLPWESIPAQEYVHMPACLCMECVGEGGSGKWTNSDQGKKRLIPSLVSIQRSYSGLSLPLENQCVPEKDRE